MKKHLRVIALAICLTMLAAGCSKGSGFSGNVYKDVSSIFEKQSAKGQIKDTYLEAITLFEENELEKARELFLELGDYEYSEMFLSTTQMLLYRDALICQENKEIDEAERLFTLLGDYRDSKQYLDSLCWDRLLEYLDEHGEIRQQAAAEEDGTTLHHVLRKDGDILEFLRISKTTGKTTIDMRYSIRFVRNDPMTTFRFDAEVTASGRFSTSYNYLKWDMRRDPIAMPGKWDQTAIDDSRNLLRNLDCNPDPYTYMFLTSEMEKMLDSLDLGITMEQLGITVWSPYS